MLFKLAIKNIRKSIKDYSIYFFTLVIAVSIFYLFNSIDSQTSMLKLTESKRDVVIVLVQAINYVSVFVSVILGFLIIYANNFLIKRRKKEMGIYLTLGMGKSKVSTILVIETFIIGLFSLIIGLILGVVLSQLLSIFTAKLFAVDMTSFKFVFSESALLKTMLYYSLIFVLAIIFNVITLSRYKLINLINASKKNQKIKFRNKYVTIITFILAITFIGYAYYLLFDNALLEVTSNKALIMILSGSVGTFFLFYSLSSFLLKVIEKIKKVYYKNINMFVLKQVNNKINTTVVSNTIISLMLLLTIGILSCSISLSDAFNKDFEKNNLTDYSIRLDPSIYVTVNGNYIPVESIENYEFLDNPDFIKINKEYVLYTHYIDENLIMRDLMTDKSFEKLQKEYGTKIGVKFNVPIISETDYKNIMNITKQEYIDIKDNEYLLLCNLDLVLNTYKDFYESKYALSINGNSLVPGSSNIINTALINSNANSNDGVIVVSDNIISSLKIKERIIIGNYKTDDENNDKILNDVLRFDHNYYIMAITRNEIEASSVGLKAMLTFIGLYLGITFAICSATVLAIGQLSESSDNKERYHILKLLGADNRVINKALFMQIGIAFMFPLIVAIFHSIVGLTEINSLINVLASLDLMTNIILTSLFILILYGGYYLLTYICSKNIIKE